MRRDRAFDVLNYFQADLSDGLDPDLVDYLLAMHLWDQASTGLLPSIARVLAWTPARAVVAAGVCLVISL